ncbi:class I SAM-dependent methyltransferase (plasmid) [Nocardiopsis eucommiae]|uniref:Class I SAM-dependent methyltransferase n=1 Tax=Nocardiopsis eucommiae TaxID=2831970 RepID=A0A975LCY5_9ACTN|nr:class I SAM-dependent methyltransferase [Nocardiopsis eucommiae]
MAEQLALRGDEKLLDLGCGNGFIIEELLPHMPAGSFVGLDVAPGILQSARKRLDGADIQAEWVEGSADELGRFQDSSFDRAIALYMMHYVDDIDQALAEAARVLRPGGLFILGTDHPDSLGEMHEVHFKALRQMNDVPSALFKSSPKNRISLTNGQEQLQRHFRNVRTHAWKDELLFPSTGAFLDFYQSHNHCSASSIPGLDLGEGFFEELRCRVGHQVNQIITQKGHFKVTKHTGLIICD